MTVNDYFNLLDGISPFSLQEKWDNSGLNLGSPTQKVEALYATLEVDLHQAQKFKPNSLIIAHHPLFFSPIKSFNLQTYPSNIASILISKNCSLIAMHTNFDHTHLNAFFASEILGFSSLEKREFALKSSIPTQSFASLVAHIKSSLQVPTLKALQASQEISKVFIVCGSGMSALPLIDPHSQSCLITGDIKHHQAMEAYSLGISLIDVGHFDSEIFFAKIIREILQNLGYEAIIEPFENPLKFY